MKRILIVLATVAVVAGIGIGVWLLVAPGNRPVLPPALETPGTWLQGWLHGSPEQKQLTASGFIEADEASVASEIGGRIVAIHAAEGEQVSEGQVLVEMDSALLEAQIEQAEADLAAAEAALAKVKAGVRPETIAQAQAVLEQAQAAEEAAKVAWEDARAIRDNPQQLELSILAAQAQLDALGYQTQQAQAMANSAQAGRDLADTVVQELAGFEPFDQWVLAGTYSLGDLPVDIPLPPDLGDGEYRWKRYRVVVHGGTVELWYLAAIRLPNDALPAAQYEQATATYQSWQAWTGLAQAQAARQGAAAYLEQLAAQKASPLALEAQAGVAEAQYKVAGATVAVARSQVDGLKMGATAEQIAAAAAQVEVARAAVDALRSQLPRFTLRAPLSGLVLARPVHPGEMATPGVPLLTLADLGNLTLTVFVPEGELGRIALGQAASVTVDAYPGRVFTGTVTLIGEQAEFTPKNVQTREERVNLVFAVKILLPNVDHALKPGMPADAILREQ